MTENFNKLVDDILLKQYSMIGKYCYSSIYDQKKHIDSIEGDIVECGVWKGGMCVFLAKLFPNKKLWVVDSFTGFEKLEEATYPTDLLEKHKVIEPHVYGYQIRTAISSSIDEVKSVFKEYDELDNPNINFLEGYVRDTLKPETCPIQNIALLRVDVDSYSATMDVLENLYPKVTKGGMIIFDDGNIESGIWAIHDFFQKNSIEMVTIDPLSKSELPYTGACHYIIKK